MSTKTEERMKQLLEEYLDIRHQKQSKEITEQIYSIFLWGVIFGTMFSYMSFMPVLFGMTLGYIFSKKQWILFDQWMEGWMSWIHNGQNYWILFWKEKEKEKEK